jgi:DNA uptake protein ComE-like DNA-binding protein
MAGRYYVEQVLKTLGEKGEMPDPGLYAAADLQIGECRLWLLGRAADRDAGEPVFALQDEAGKLNLNTAELGMIEDVPGMTPELAAAIVDWRDADDEISPYGAESETYLGREPPSTAKNAPFESVDELRLLNGADPRFLAGRDRNRNLIIEPWEEDLARETQERFEDVPDLGLLDAFTVCSREPDTTADGQPRIALDRGQQAVAQALQEGGIESGRGTAMAANAPGSRSVLMFCVRAKASDAEAEVAFDRLTTSARSPVVGRVNINTASSGVLACLPGVGEDGAERLVAYRERNPEALTTPMWLARALGDEAAIAAGPYVTTRTYQIAADVVAVGPSGLAFRRTRFIFDLTTGTPIVVSRRDLTHLGWPLGEELHASLVTHGRAPP